MENISIFEIEQLIANKNFTDAALNLHHLLMQGRTGKHFAETIATNRIDPTLIAIYTRFAKCLFDLFVDYNNYPLNASLFTAWLTGARELRSVFIISGFYRTDFLIHFFDSHFREALSQHSRGSDRAADIEQLALRILLLSMLENDSDIDFTVFFKFFPGVTLATILSLLSSMVVITPEGSAKREQLLDYTSLFEKYVMPNTTCLLDLSAVWMLCSYALRRDKHTIKSRLNASLASWLLKNDILPKTVCKPHDPLHKKPVMLVVLEFFRAIHSMGRSYGAALNDLKEKFELVALPLVDSEASDEGYRLFDKIISFDCYCEGSNIVDISKLRDKVQLIADLAPDIIFYPSLGMQQTAVILANMRLAPIQMISFGHPASSFCDAIDYGIIEADYAVDAEDLFSERMILLPPESLVSQPLKEIKQFVPSIKHHKEQINIAVSSILLKISANFLQVCGKIMGQSKRKVDFIFFLNEVEINYLQCKKDIFNIMPYAQVLCRLEAASYLENLNRCDLYLSTFPFGGANSVIDAMCVGLPVVCLRGDDIAGRTDSALIRRRGLPEWLVAHSEEEYIAAALRLIHDDDERIALSEMILSRSKELFPEHNPNYQQQNHSFSTACWQIYKKHQALQHYPKKSLSLDELCKLGLS